MRACSTVLSCVLLTAAGASVGVCLDGREARELMKKEVPWDISGHTHSRKLIFELNVELGAYHFWSTRGRDVFYDIYVLWAPSGEKAVFFDFVGPGSVETVDSEKGEEEFLEKKVGEFNKLIRASGVLVSDAMMVIHADLVSRLLFSSFRDARLSARVLRLDVGPKVEQDQNGRRTLRVLCDVLWSGKVVWWRLVVDSSGCVLSWDKVTLPGERLPDGLRR